MRAHELSQHALTQISRPAGSTRCAPAAPAVRAQAGRLILVLALLSVIAATVAAAQALGIGPYIHIHAFQSASPAYTTAITPWIF